VLEERTDPVRPRSTAGCRSRPRSEVAGPRHSSGRHWDVLLTISTTHRPATDLGFLLHKNPARAQSTTVSVGTAHVVYPEAAEERCTAALLLEVDPIALVRGQRGGRGAAGPEAFSLAQYVNDLPYAARSMFAA
jgi:RNA repair, ligase-Pnkp-associating, region of Hen1